MTEVEFSEDDDRPVPEAVAKPIDRLFGSEWLDPEEHAALLAQLPPSPPTFR